MAVARLLDMGIEPFLVASALECVVAQRLARRLCEECRTPVTVGSKELEKNGFGSAVGDFQAYGPVGCVRCGGNGYRGRIGLYEVMTITDEIRPLILQKSSSDAVSAAAATSGMRRLRDDGLEKVRQGLTSIPEVLRVLGT
jgi:type IV pilus assembly protein PilB